MHFLANFLPFGSRFMIAWALFAVLSFIVLVIVNPSHIKMHEDDPYEIDVDDFFVYAICGTFIGFAYPIVAVLLVVAYLFSKFRKVAVGYFNVQGSINEAGWVRKLRQY